MTLKKFVRRAAVKILSKHNTGKYTWCWDGELMRGFVQGVMNDYWTWSDIDKIWKEKIPSGDIPTILVSEFEDGTGTSQWIPPEALAPGCKLNRPMEI